MTPRQYNEVLRAKDEAYHAPSSAKWRYRSLPKAETHGAFRIVLIHGRDKVEKWSAVISREHPTHMLVNARWLKTEWAK